MKKHEEPRRGVILKRHTNLPGWECAFNDGLIEVVLDDDFISMNSFPIQMGSPVAAFEDRKWCTEASEEQSLTNRFLYKVELVDPDGSVIPHYVISPNTEEVAKWLPKEFDNPFVKSITFVSDQVFKTHVP